MKTPDSIKAKANDYADDARIKMYGQLEARPLTEKERFIATRAYLQCYRDLAAGEPDYMIANQHGEFLPWTPSKGTLEEDRPSLVLYRDLGVAEFDLKVLGGAKDGWRITPVKLLKMEGES